MPKSTKRPDAPGSKRPSTKSPKPSARPAKGPNDNRSVSGKPSKGQEQKSLVFGRLFLVDGSALAYRSHFAFIRKPLINSKGENTSAVFGFTRALLKILDEERPEYMAVIFDAREPTFRHKKFAEYKATRERMPAELVDQLPRINAVVEALGVPILQAPGFEADDVMATLAQRAAAQNLEVLLVTGDKDLMQLIGPSIKMLRFTSAAQDEGMEIIDADAVREKMGVPPSKIIDFLGLRGDTSDNVPGVPGVGDVTARQLLEEYGSLDAVLEHAAEVKKAALRKNLIEFREQALLSRELVTLDLQVPLTVSLNDIACKQPDQQRASELFRELEFNSLASRFADVPADSNASGPPSTFEIVDTPQKLMALAEQLRASDIFAFDTETTSANPIDAELVGMSFAWREGHGVYVPIAPMSENDGDDFFLLNWGEKFSAKKILQPILENAALRKCGQNAKYDMLVMARYGVQMRGVAFDTMLASYLLSPGGRQHNLDALALEHLHFKKIPTSDLIGSGKKQTTMREAPVEKVAAYAAEDADITLRLYNVFAPKLKEQELSPLFEKVEMPLIPVLATVEATGVTLDLDYLQEMSNKLGKDLKKLEEIIFTLAGEEFNLNSPAQLSKILFEKLKLPTKKRTKTGFSTDADVLESLAKKFELPKILLDYRELSKLKSTYVDALPKLVNPRTGRVHTSYNQAVAATGRLSSSDPNLQNIPIRTEAGRQIRRAFIPPPGRGWKLLDADYSQIELRIMAHLSKDEALTEIFRRDADVHRDTAGRMFGVPPEEVTPDMRRGAKEINFGIMYGMGAYGLSQRLQISVEEGEIFINNYFKQFPGVQAFIDQTIADAREKGYVTTMLGRRRYLPEINSDNRQRREFAERIAVNTPMQGSNADIIKLAMINIHRRLQEEKLSAHMILQVHDELVFEAPEEELPQLEKLVRHEMANAVQLSVPIKIGIGIGENWLEAHD
jgi:DNA polymerase-1